MNETNDVTLQTTLLTPTFTVAELSHIAQSLHRDATATGTLDHEDALNEIRRVVDKEYALNLCHSCCAIICDPKHERDFLDRATCDDCALRPPKGPRRHAEGRGPLRPVAHYYSEPVSILPALSDAALVKPAEPEPKAEPKAITKPVSPLSKKAHASWLKRIEEKVHARLTGKGEK